MTDRELDENALVRNQHVVEALERSLRSSQHALEVVPGLVRRCLLEDSWREFVTQRGERIQHERLIDFVEAQPLKGLGASRELVYRICADHQDVLTLLDKALDGRAGPRPGTGDQADEVPRPPSASSLQAMRRLEKDAPELHARVVAGELSTNRAMQEAGLRPPTAVVRLDNAERTAEALRRRLKPEQIRELVKALLADEQ